MGNPIGLGIVVVAYGFIVHDASIRWVEVTPAKWSMCSQLRSHLAENYLLLPTIVFAAPWEIWCIDRPPDDDAGSTADISRFLQ